jgi:multidrug resistance efflux pump
MSRRVVLISLGVLAIVGAAVAGIYYVVNPTPAQPEVDDLTASGFIEAEEVTIAPELGGRVVELLVEEGDVVSPNQVVARLDGSLLEAQIEAAQAGLDMANAQLARAQAGARPEQIRQAEAELAQAEAGRDGAYQGWQDLIAIRDNPQELNGQIAQARAGVAVAEAALAQATAMKDAADIALGAYDDAVEAVGDARRQIRKLPESVRPPLPEMPWQTQGIPNAYWKAWVGVNMAQAGLDGARTALSDLYAIKDNPQELDAQIDAAEAQYRSAEAAVEMAQAQLDALEAGATEEEIAIAEAQVAQAQAALDALLVLREKQNISAPVGGIVLEMSIREGELAAPGATLLTLGDLYQVTLTVYVPENRLSHVMIGQEVEVSVDSSDQTFLGEVVAIANEAEFTPRNVQTQEERVNMVFAVEISIPNPAPAYPLKPGLPADAVIGIQESSR